MKPNTMQSSDFPIYYFVIERFSERWKRRSSIAMLSIFLVLSIFSFSVAAVGDLLPISVNPERQRLVDNFGREVFFQGTNVVVKGFPWHPGLEVFPDGTLSKI